MTGTIEYDIKKWVKKELNADNLSVNSFTVSSIGTLGAYLCLVKDETIKENLENYGIKMLQEKNPMELHGYSPSLGIASVKAKIAQSLEERFGMPFFHTKAPA